MEIKNIWTGFILLSLVILTAMSGRAAELYTTPNGTGDCSTGNPCNLQTALNTAGTNGQDDTIHLSAGTYDASGGTFIYDPTVWNPTENYPLTIKGQGAGVSKIDGGHSKGGVYIVTQGLNNDTNAHITVEGITFQYGKTLGYGGGIRIFTESNTMIKDCDFIGNTAGFDGGGIDVTSNHGNITYTNNRFVRNKANYGGGGAAAWSGDDIVTLTNNIFIENTAEQGGGAYGFSRLNTIIFTNNIFSNNVAEGISEENGGGAYVSSLVGPITVTNNTFSSNSANNSGVIFSLTD